MLSVIISSCKKNKLVQVHVRECINSSLIPDEIIVVDDSGDPESNLKELLQELDIKTKLIYARVKEDIAWNYTGARNLGVWLSTGNYLSIEDDDHIPHKDFYKEAIKALEEKPDFGRVKTHKRWVVELDDILEKPVEEWNILGSRVAHQDVCVIRRDVYLKVKGYDERFAGAYGWSATDWKRRLQRLGVKYTNAGYQYVVQAPKSRGLSSRNWKMAREQKGIQSPKGIINFIYEYEILTNKKR